MNRKDLFDIILTGLLVGLLGWSLAMLGQSALLLLFLRAGGGG